MTPPFAIFPHEVYKTYIYMHNKSQNMVRLFPKHELYTLHKGPTPAPAGIQTHEFLSEPYTLM